MLYHALLVLVARHLCDIVHVKEKVGYPATRVDKREEEC